MASEATRGNGTPIIRSVRHMDRPPNTLVTQSNKANQVNLIMPSPPPLLPLRIDETAISSENTEEGIPTGQSQSYNNYAEYPDPHP